MEFDELKILLAVESKWMVSLNGLEFVPLDSSDISIEGSAIQLGPHKRFISDLKWLRPDVVRLRTRPTFRAQTDTITLYPGDRLPPLADHRRRRAFQTEIGQALCATLVFGAFNGRCSTLTANKELAVHIRDFSLPAVP